MQSQRPIETLLFMQREKDFNSCLNELNPIGIPVLRLDGANGFKLGEHFNSEALALLCIQQPEDVMLLQCLAEILDRIRETRALIWLNIAEADPEEYLALIADRADTYNLMNMLVLHSMPMELSISAYRLQPFPEATFAPLNDSDGGKIFNRIWGDFQQRTAIAHPSLHIPGSFLAKHRVGGGKYLGGYMDRLIKQFARIYNIRLRFRRPVNESSWLSDMEIRGLVRRKEVDLPMYGRIFSFNTEYTTYLDIAQVFIVVPCGKEMRLDDIYKSLRPYFLVTLGVYLIFALLEQLLELANQRIGRREGVNWNWFTWLVNLRAFAGALGLPIGIIRRYRSLTMRQFLMLMYVFSLVFSCFFSASLSALLTKLPCYQHIQNFEELQRSGLPVMFDEYAASMSELQENRVQIGQLTNKVLAPNIKRNDLMFALDTHHAYQTSSRLWQIVNNYQSRYRRNVLCASPGLILFYDYPIVGLVQSNSVFKATLNEFIYRAHDVGLVRHWILEAMRSLTATQIEPHNQTHSYAEFTQAPLTNRDLLWVL
ncbi:hypothetical protein AWZ03_001096 [Drosophila navojoa]|uniref:Ionotropic glutamate receptor L-glutamate and glycine-binding domain-containing protein n=1 Tax=Drosophila navojoa TaxID=7232 RepID=A0A484BTZ2_DRONA|nr:uncharacterized protein LOC115564239 [Drosophila navojoa]TDG52266.1 hypothetical protein AWZ03_001096 [Drosophila navojoa]